jgi:MYXO-CTERM domain-containing protein
VPSVDADIDIDELKIPGRFKTEIRPLRPKVVLRNNSAVAGTATATLRGVLDGVTVYDETIPVELPAGGAGDFTFSSYVPPVVKSAILWTLTVVDQDPDVDEATARTVIAYRPFVTSSSGLTSADEVAGGCSSGAGGAELAALLGLALLAARRRFAGRSGK